MQLKQDGRRLILIVYFQLIRNNMKTIITFLTCFLFSVSFSFSQDFDYSFLETYKVSTPATMNIGTSDGNISVIPTSGNEIKVYFIARKNGRVLDISRQELEKELTVEVNHGTNSLQINVRHELTNSWFNMNQIDVGFRIFAPKDIACTLHTSDGNIKLEGLNGDQDCKTSDGNISISDIKGRTNGVTSDGNLSINGIVGDLTVRTSDGNISIDEITGDVQSTTSDGNISLNVVSGDVQAVTSDGSIKLISVTGTASARTSDGHIVFEDFAGSLTAITSDGNISGNITRLQTKLTARTSGGNVDITIPDKLGLDLDIRGESINVPLINFSGRSDEKTIHGQSNGGGISVNIEASDGNIRLAYR